MHPMPSLELARPCRFTQGYADLLAHARCPDDTVTLALAGVIGRALASGQRPLIRGLTEARFQYLLRTYFPRAALTNGCSGSDAGVGDEFQDLLELLLDHRTTPSEPLAWLSHAVASAAMGENHLWQDMGLPNRAVLSRLLGEHFQSLAARNQGDMKWKKFFYRQLCERAGVPICKAPHCAECVDYHRCFGPESP